MNEKLDTFNRQPDEYKERYLEQAEQQARDLQEAVRQVEQGRYARSTIEDQSKVIDKLRSTERKVIRIAAGVCLLFVALAAGCPPYSVWQQELSGKAELAKAEQNRQILINEAKAKEASAEHWANAEIERARGAAEANRIVANSLGGPEGYLRWLYIEKLSEIKNGQIIYLPTEAAMPILEAGKRNGNQ